MDTLALRVLATASTARRRAVALALLLGGGLTLGLVLLLGVASPAAAHDRLVSTSPTDGAVLETAPPLVELTFSGEVTNLGSALVIEDASGAPVQDAPPTIGGTVVRSPVPPDVGLGTYLVRWRVVAGDGHPIEGTFGFTVSDEAAPGAGTDAPTDAPSDSPTESPTGGSTDTPATAEPSPSQVVADGTILEDGGSSLVPVLGALLGVGALAGVIVALVRRRRS